MELFLTKKNTTFRAHPNKPHFSTHFTQTQPQILSLDRVENSVARVVIWATFI